jgi:predicted RNase H-like HicB family nuclease
MRYPIAIESRTEQTAYGVVVPDLPGCFSAGDTLEEAIAAAEEASLAWIETALDADDPIRHPPRSRRSERSRNSQAGSFRLSPSIRPFSTTLSSASTSRYRVGCCGAWMTKRALQARRDRAISRSSPSNTEKGWFGDTKPRRWL